MPNSSAGPGAAAIVSAVRGEEMLAEIVSATEEKVKAITSEATAGTTALKFAVGGSDASHLAQDAAKAGASRWKNSAKGIGKRW